MKIKNCLLILLIMNFLSCRIIETQSSPQTLKFKIENTDSAEIKAFVNSGAGNFTEIKCNENLIYTTDIPAMGGGYKTFFGIKYAVHDPNDYKIVRIIKGKIIWKELSLNDIKNFQKSDNEYFIIN